MSRLMIVTMRSDSHLKDEVQEEAVEVIHNATELLQKRIKRLLQKSENKKCLDCFASKPKWATLISIPLMSHTPTGDGLSAKSIPENASYIGGFCCLECSGAHRRLGTHICFVRSTQLDTLKEHEILALEMGGNRLINSIYEGNVSSDELKPHANSEQKSRETYIRNKYDKKKYICNQQMTKLRQHLQNRNHQMQCYNHNSSILSPTMSEISGASTVSNQSSNTKSSSSSSSSSQVQLQIFTSSPRTLAMIQKYMNPKNVAKNKKKSNGKTKKTFRLFPIFSRKKINSRSSMHDIRQEGVSVNQGLNMIQIKSVDMICPRNHQKKGEIHSNQEQLKETKSMNPWTKKLAQTIPKILWKTKNKRESRVMNSASKTLASKSIAVEGANEYHSFCGIEGNSSTQVVVASS